jgi:hypothetical protein
VLKRSIGQLPIGTDIPRLTKFMTLIDCRKDKEEIVFRGDANRTPENIKKTESEKRTVQTQMKDFFIALASLVEPEKVAGVDENFGFFTFFFFFFLITIVVNIIIHSTRKVHRTSL